MHRQIRQAQSASHEKAHGATLSVAPSPATSRAEARLVGPWHPTKPRQRKERDLDYEAHCSSAFEFFDYLDTLPMSLERAAHVDKLRYFDERRKAWERENE